MKGWKAPIYALYRPEVDVEKIKERVRHRFHCAGPGCNHIVNRYIDGPDATSTSNLRTHIKKCVGWGPGTLEAIDRVSTKAEALAAIQKVTRGEAKSITMAFKRIGKGKVTYSTRSLTSSETRYVLIHGVHLENVIVIISIVRQWSGGALKAYAPLLLQATANFIS